MGVAVDPGGVFAEEVDVLVRRPRPTAGSPRRGRWRGGTAHSAARCGCCRRASRRSPRRSGRSSWDCARRRFPSPRSAPRRYRHCANPCRSWRPPLGRAAVCPSDPQTVQPHARLPLRSSAARSTPHGQASHSRERLRARWTSRTISGAFRIFPSPASCSTTSPRCCGTPMRGRWRWAAWQRRCAPISPTCWPAWKAAAS